MALLPGTRLGHYEILARLGAGGMGEVYRARDPKLGREVAIKVLPVELIHDEVARVRLLREARLAATLNHPSICTIHEVGEDGEHIYLAMELIEGQPLSARIAERAGGLPVESVARYGAEIAAALAHAHQKQVIHRDLKASNVIVLADGRVKVLDFGIARRAWEPADEAARTLQMTLTETGAIVGTPHYLAPEVLQGAKADERSDLWALGVLLHEMAGGALPFQGATSFELAGAILHALPAALPDRVPAGLRAVVAKCLAKEPGERYERASEVRAALETLLSASAVETPAVAPAVQPTPAPHGRPRGPARRRSLGWIAAGIVGIGLIALAGWWAVHASRVRAARRSVPQLRALVQDENFSAAFRLMRSIEPDLSGDPGFEAAREGLLVPATIHTVPEGAAVYLKGYDEPDADWIGLGRSPLDIRGPNGYYRWRIVKPGFVTFEGARMAGPAAVTFSLLPEGTVPEGMVFVPPGAVQVGGVGTVPVDSFFIDRYEVTNRQFKTFVDAGGYAKREYWREPFLAGGRTLTWEEGMTRLRDATGRPGPSTWELSAYPEGQDDAPVSGVSWYEALAYAAWAGKELPTVHHWRQAAPDGIFSDILEYSNYSNQQVAAVGTYQGIGEYGTYDMAGNVREWCWNLERDRRYILGGAWNQPNYMYQNPDALDAFDRSPINGFRCIKRTSTSAAPEALLRPVESIMRDYSRAVPVSDREFDIYRRLYAYDPTDLKPAVEATDNSSEAWRIERVSYAAPYGGERIVAYLFLPRHVQPPYQTVVYFPHSGGVHLRSFEQSEMSYLGFVVKGGRALLLPMYKGTYERRLERPPDGPHARRDLTIARVKDLQRSVDYLRSRSDIDHDRIAYFGVSLGARLGTICLAIERRFRAAVLWSGGFRTSITPEPPEIDEINFAPRVTTPVLMLNGRQDFNFPIETSQAPMFRLLGTATADKRHVIYDGGHVFPFARIIKDTLEWLDQYMGVPRSGASPETGGATATPP